MDLWAIGLPALTGFVLLGGLALFSILLTRGSNDIAMFWPANAALVCYALQQRGANAPFLVVGGFLANCLVQALFGDPILVCVGLSFANLAEICLLLAILRRLELGLGSVVELQSAIAAVLVMAAAPCFASMVGAGTLHLAFGAPFGVTMALWWVSDFVCLMIVLLPFLTADPNAVQGILRRRYTVRCAAESTAVCAVTAVQIRVVDALDMPLSMVVIVPMLWVALRLGTFWTSVSASGLAVFLSMMAIAGHWPLIEPVGTMAENVLKLQTILIMSGIPPFVVAALNASRDRAVAMITESERRAHEKSAALEVTLSSMNQGLSMFDAAGKLVIWNWRYAELFGIEPRLLQPGTSLVSLLKARRTSDGLERDAEAIVAQQKLDLAQGSILHTKYRLKNGLTIATVISPMDGGGWVSTHEDITDREAAAQRVAHAAHHDVLTGLANRAELRSRLADAFSDCASGKGSFSIFVLDLDRFKAINDTFGHGVGDMVLVEVANRLQAIVGPQDIVARLGGDEFAILCRPIGDQREGASAIASRLLLEIGAPFYLEGRCLHIGVSIGIASAPDHGTDGDVLVRNADSALYKVKSNGKNAYRFFDAALEVEARERREIEADLRDALEKEQFELHYQTIRSLVTGKVVSAEALIRWRHPMRGLVKPDLFIPIAEESGLILGIGEWAIGQACRDAASWPADVSVAVNVSAAQLGKTDLVGVVTRALFSAGIEPRRLTLEVTETIFLRNDEMLLADFHVLHNMGVQLSLDDFGSGYSSLGYLRKLPFDKIKIDRSFIVDIEDNPQSAAVVCAIANLARSLGIDAVAEGLETESQVSLVTAAGCNLAQGFFFHRPCPVDRLPFGAQNASASPSPVA